MKRVAFLPLLLPLLLAAPTHAKGNNPETKQSGKIAKVFVDYARWLKVKGQKEEAQQAIAEARAADPDAKDLARLATEVEALPDSAQPDPGLERRRKKAHRDAAKLYDKLAAIEHDPKDTARFEGYLFKALELEPSKSRIGKISGRIKQLASNRKGVAEAGRLLVRLREADPKGRYDALEAQLAQTDVVLIKSPDHAIVGYLSLPKGWSKNGSYSILVAVDGAGSNFLGAGRNFAKRRGSRPFIVLAPCSFSNTNAIQPQKYPFYSKEVLDEGSRNRIEFDDEGLQALLKVVRERFGGKEKIGITGFSGGGNLCYAMTALFPERILFSAPACANFSGMGYNRAKPVDGGGPPVHIMTGARDPHREFTHGNKNSPGIEPQTDNAMKALEALNFTNVKRTMLPGVKHSPCHAKVWDFCDEVVG